MSDVAAEWQNDVKDPKLSNVCKSNFYKIKITYNFSEKYTRYKKTVSLRKFEFSHTTSYNFDDFQVN